MILKTAAFLCEMISIYCLHRLNSSTKTWYSNLVVSSQIHINKEARNMFYRSLNMLLVHKLIYLIRASYISVIQKICKIIFEGL